MKAIKKKRISQIYFGINHTEITKANTIKILGGKVTVENFNMN